jgi:hypothetical protein
MGEQTEIIEAKVDRVLKRRHSVEDAKKAMSDPGNILKVIVAAFTLGGLWFALNQNVLANTDEITDVSARVEVVEDELATVKTILIDLARRDKTQVKTVNWIGLALEEIAKKQDVELPQRPLISED